MKKFYAILCLAIASLTQLQAQAPQGFNYQATVRNSSGDLIVNTNVYFKFNVIQGSNTAVPIFTETHYVPTDDLGQVNLIIGQGTANTGTFSALDWSLGSYYLGIELNTGNGYVAMGTTQLLSVPYALYAENSGNSTPTTPNLETVLAENNSANNQQIKDLQDPTDAQDAVTKAYVDNNLTTSPWYVNATNDSISYDRKVVIGSSINQNVPALNVYGTDTGPLSPTAAFIRSRYRNNVLLFETSELDNDFVGSIGLIEAAENNAWPNSFVIGINDGVSWFNPLRIYYDNKALRFGFGSDNYYDPNSFGESSLSLGYNSFANGNYSTALGVDNIASGLNSTALGLNSQASAHGAIVLGVNSLASGANSTAIGLNSNAAGSGATALGLNATATGDFSNAFGIDVEAQSFAETVIGRYNTLYEPIGGVDGYDLDDRMFVVGNGQSDNDRSDALIIKKSGDMSVEGNQIKNLAEPTDSNDAVNKSYADNLMSSSFGYQQWSNNQVWNANTTIAPEPNSFWFINAENTTITLPPISNQGDVIKIYYMGAGINNFAEIGHMTFIDAQTNNLFVGFKSRDLNNNYADGFGSFSSEIKPFKLHYGLNELVQIGDYWMLGEIEAHMDDFDFDNDGYSINQGDCDDANAQVNPGATEIEDGVDNDCDGDIDEGFDASGIVTDIDGNTYGYLTYGDQVWTVENAEMVTYRDGTEIPQVTDPTQWSSLTTGAWCYYNNDPTKPRLYNWYAVMGIHDTDPNTPNKEFAPEGWHVPSDAEWTTLEEYLIANGYNYDGTTTGNKIAKAMASTTGWDSSITTGAVGNDQSTNNSSGFNAFPEGNRYYDGSFFNEGLNAIFWSSTEYNSNLAWTRNLSNNVSYLFRNYTNKQYGFSVRFVRD